MVADNEDDADNEEKDYVVVCMLDSGSKTWWAMISTTEIFTVGIWTIEIRVYFHDLSLTV